MTEKGKKAGLGGASSRRGRRRVHDAGRLTALAILALAEGMDAWLAALIVTAVWAIVAGVLGITGKSKLEEVGTPVPRKRSSR